MIYIDFQGGTHGNFLEFVCNKHLAGVLTEGTPFNSLGASHSKTYLDEKVFVANHWHYFRGKTMLPESGTIISIHTTDDDILPLTAIVFLHGGNYNIDLDKLQEDTYNKLSNVDMSGLNQLLKESYLNERGIPFDEHNPNCPRYILRDLFKMMFITPSNSGIQTQQREYMKYTNNHRVYYFPYNCFYNKDKFFKELTELSNYLNLPILNSNELDDLYNEFLSKQPFTNLKIESDILLEKLYNKEQFKLPNLSMIQEAYVAANLELHYDNDRAIFVENWFVHSNEIYEHFK